MSGHLLQDLSLTVLSLVLHVVGNHFRACDSKGKEKNGLSLPFQSSLSATFTDSTTIFTFIASLSSIQAHTPQMSVTWGDDDNEDAVSRGVIDMLSNFTVFDIISIPQPRGRQYQHEAISLIYQPPSFTYLRLIYPHLVHISPSYTRFS